MSRVGLLGVLGLVMHAANQFMPTIEGPGRGGAVTLAIGYLLLTAFIAGSLFKQLRLPRLTGYLAAGVIAGPEVLGLVHADVLGTLRIFNGVAISLIALTAGTEMHLASMRPLLRSVGWITGVAVIGTTLLLAVAAFVARPLLPFMAHMSFAQAAAISLVLGVTMVAQSPAVVVALRDEMNADGPLSRTVMGVVVIADIVVIVMFALVSSLALATFGANTDILATFRALAWELFGSLAIGVGIGALIGLYMHKRAGSGALFVVAVSFLVAEVGTRVHLDPLLVMLAAGVVIRNTSAVVDRLHHGIEAAALPVYVAFFAVAGATIHLHAIATMAIPAMLMIAVRTTGFLAGTRYAARVAQAPPSVVRYGGFGLLPQAGLALALALIFARTFPQFGAEASALIFGVVALNELIAPIAFRIALVRSGEAGQRAPKPPLGTEPHPSATPDPNPAHTTG